LTRLRSCLSQYWLFSLSSFFFQAEDGIRDDLVTGVQTLLFRSRYGWRGQPPGDPRHPYRDRDFRPSVPVSRTGHTTARTANPVQIGRASCRERVEVPVVDGWSEEKIGWV